MPPLEAMALGTPVACSEATSIPEIVGDAGEYFDPEDTSSLVCALEAVLYSSTRRETLINAGYVRSACFSWKRCAQETVSVYRNIVEKVGDK